MQSAARAASPAPSGQPASTDTTTTTNNNSQPNRTGRRQADVLSNTHQHNKGATTAADSSHCQPARLNNINSQHLAPAVRNHVAVHHEHHDGRTAVVVDGNGAAGAVAVAVALAASCNTSLPARSVASGARASQPHAAADQASVDIKPTPKRYLILLLFCLFSSINAAQWIYLSSITGTVANFYRVSNLAVNWTSMVYMLVYIPLIVPSTWLFERIGMRNAIVLGSMGTSLGALIKCFSCQPDRYYLLMFGQTIVATSQLFVLSVPPRLASVWFPDHQVSLANACGVFGNQLGIALGFVVPQLIVGNETHHLAAIQTGLWALFGTIALVSCTVSACILVLFDEQPAKAPGIARLMQIKQEQAGAIVEAAGVLPLMLATSGGGTGPGSGSGSGNTATGLQDCAWSGASSVRGAPCNKHQKRHHHHHHSKQQQTHERAPQTSGSAAGFLALLRELLTSRDFVLLMLGYGLNVGVFYAISTILNQMIAPIWPNANTIVAQLGLIMVVSGMFGSMISGYVLDKTHMYRAVNASLYAMSLLSLTVFALTFELRNMLALHTAVILLGYFMTGYLFIGYEMSNEITWPRPESVTAGLLNLSAQIFGVSLTYAGSWLVESYGTLVTNALFIAALVLGLTLTLMITAQLKRQGARNS